MNRHDTEHSTDVERHLRDFDQAPGFIIVVRGPEHVVDFVNAGHRALFNSSGWIGKPMREAFPTLNDQSFLERLDSVYADWPRASPSTN
jgi:hypothetical protein